MKLVQLVLLFILLQTLKAHPGAQHRIHNGFDAHPEESTYVVKLKMWEKHVSAFGYCTGSLITNQHVLTAAHCLFMAPTALVEAYLGTNEFFLGCSNYWTFHPTDDFAVVKFNQQYLPAYIQPIGLPSMSDVDLDLTGSTAVVHGWGRTENGSRAETLQSMEVTIASMNYTTKMFRNAEFFCANVLNRPSVDQGDSGGPMVINGKLFGVSSFIEPENITDGNVRRKITSNGFAKVTDCLGWISKEADLYVEL